MKALRNLSKTEQNKLIQILLGFACLIAGALSPLEGYLTLLFYVPGYLIVGFTTLKFAFLNILKGQIFDENFLMSMATIGAFALGEYPEAIGVMLFYQVGTLFESYAVDQSRKSIADLMDIRPDHANLLKDGVLFRVAPEAVQIGEVIQIKPGEKVPLDGVILEGFSSLDTSSLTGEWAPRDSAPGDEVISGCINLTGLLTVKVLKNYEESTVAKILELVENASDKKANLEGFITRFARYYTPVVVIVACLLAFIPPLFFSQALFSDWIYRALTFLVISCPCALVISIPLSFFAGVGGASSAGILVKGSNYLEALANAEIVVFDKTGTLTKGIFQVSEIHPARFISKEGLLEMAAYAEHYSNHPISASLKKAYGKEIQPGRISDATELPGFGIEAYIDHRRVLAGNAKLMALRNISGVWEHLDGTVVHVAIDDKYSGCILIADQLKPDAALAISSLKASGIKQTVMLTGDQESIAQLVGRQAGIDIVYAQLLPGDKVKIIEELLKKTSKTGKLVYLGDGVNDAPVLARSDIGIAMGGLGSDAAIEAADMVIMNDELSKLATVIRISKKTLGIARQNVVLALGIKFGVLLLGAMGMATMWAAVFADVGVTVIAILNAMRALKVSK